jgi:hypothetical protein
MFSAFTPSVSPVGARGRASFVRQLGQKKIFFIEMGATCAGHVTEKTLTASCKKASTTVLAQEDGREQLAAAAARRISLH